MPALRPRLFAMSHLRSTASPARLTSEALPGAVHSQEIRCERSVDCHHRYGRLFIEDIPGSNACLFHRDQLRPSSTVLGGGNRLHRRSSAFGRDLIEVGLSIARNPHRWRCNDRHGSEPGERADTAFSGDHCMGIGMHVLQSSGPHAPKLRPVAGGIYGASCRTAVGHSPGEHVRHGRVAH